MLFAVLLLCVFQGALALGWNATQSAFALSQAETSLWLSAAAYCGKDAYPTHKFGGPTAGFVYTATLVDKKSDIEGFVGYLPSDKSIYVAFRGSSDVRNWVTNLDAWKTDYTSYPECNCEVHKGFYKAEQAVLSDAKAAVQKLKQTYPSYSVKVTGHSLGAAVAHLMAMDLAKAGYAPSVYNFGQPRVGDKSYASFAGTKVPTWRVTHNRDIVPHIPLTSGMDYYHECTEQFEDVAGNLHTCNQSCEDPSCADQYSLRQTNVDDHMLYLGLDVSCDAVSR